jgi:Holliday junction resolvase RusA-like endonuclease
MASLGLTQYSYFVIGKPIHIRVKFVVPVPRINILGDDLAPNAWPFPHNGNINNILKFILDALEKTLYMGGTYIVHKEVVKAYPTDILEPVGWTELDFMKVRIE